MHIQEIKQTETDEQKIEKDRQTCVYLQRRTLAERDRQTSRQADMQRHTDGQEKKEVLQTKDRQIGFQERQVSKQIQTNIKTDRKRHRQTKVQRRRRKKTDIQDRQTSKQADRLEAKHTDTLTKISKQKTEKNKGVSKQTDRKQKYR